MIIATLLVMLQIVVATVLWLLFGWEVIGIIAVVALIRWIMGCKKKKDGGA